MHPSSSRRVLRIDSLDRPRRPSFLETPSSTITLPVAAADEPARWVSSRAMAWLLTVPAILLAVLTGVFWWTDADRAIVSLFYQPQGGPQWPVGDEFLWRSLYHQGPWVALSLGIGGGILAAASVVLPLLRPWRLAGAFFLWLLLLGPGFLVNTVLKDNLNRPRPHETVDFGGALQYVPVWAPCAFRNDNSSFPSGHAALGFFMIAPAFVLMGQRPRWALAALGLGLTFGLLMGIARVAQGGHYPSDVLWSAGIIYFAAWAVWGGTILVDRFWQTHIDSWVDRQLGYPTASEPLPLRETIAMPVGSRRRRLARRRLVA